MDFLRYGAASVTTLVIRVKILFIYLCSIELFAFEERGEVEVYRGRFVGRLVMVESK